ncbi:MAG: HTTM domain-containing protein [Planctomycetota bacterium]
MTISEPPPEASVETGFADDHRPPPPAGGLDRLTIYAAVWAVTSLFHLISFGVWVTEPVGIALFAATVTLLLNPRSATALCAAAAVNAVYIFLRSPNTANHILFDGVVNLTVVLVLLPKLLARGPLDRDDVFERLGLPLRAFLLVLYFFAVLHKLNRDFFDPDVTAAGELLRQLKERFAFVPTGEAVIFANAVFTIVIETAIPVCLFFKRTRPIGLLAGLAFHFVLALHPHQGLFSFTSMLFLLYLFFLPADFDRRLSSWAAASPIVLKGLTLFGLMRRRLVTLLVVGAVAGGLAAAAVLVSGVDLKSFRRLALVVGVIAWVPWGVAVVTAYIGVLKTVPETAPRPTPWRWRPVLLLPAFMTVFYLSPYFGFGTTRVLSMFSNLRTEGPEPNHLFIPQALRLTDGFQDDFTYVSETNDYRIDRHTKTGAPLPWFEFRRLAYEADRPFIATYERAGERHTVEAGPGDPLPFPRPHFLATKVLSFRPVDVTGPAKSRW